MQSYSDCRFLRDRTLSLFANRIYRSESQPQVLLLALQGVPGVVMSTSGIPREPKATPRFANTIDISTPFYIIKNIDHVGVCRARWHPIEDILADCWTIKLYKMMRFTIDG